VILSQVFGLTSFSFNRQPKFSVVPITLVVVVTGVCNFLVYQQGLSIQGETKMTWTVLIVGSYLVFIVISIALAAVGRSRPDRPVPSNDLLENIMQHRITRIGTFMSRWWIGWHFMVGQTIR
jgi:hypothetical protein